MRTLKILLASVVFAAATPGLASTAITGFSGGTQFQAFSTDETVGFTFKTSSNLSVTSVGWYSPGAALASSHQIGIWDASGTLLGGGTVTAGAPTAGGFRYTSVSAFTLASGAQYFIGGRDLIGDGDAYVTSVSGLTTDSLITFLGSAVSPSGSGFAFPNSVNNTTTGGRFGANFQFTDLGAGGVPEPASWALMIGGFGLAGAAMRRRRQSVRVTYA